MIIAIITNFIFIILLKYYWELRRMFGVDVLRIIKFRADHLPLPLRTWVLSFIYLFASRS